MKSGLKGLLALLCVLAPLGIAFAQAPAQAPPAGPPPDAAGAAAPRAAAGVDVFKFTFATFDQYSYQQHPFLQMTGNDAFADTGAGTGTSALIGSVDSDIDANFLEKAFHILPPFGLEYIVPFNLMYLGGVGIGFDYIQIAQTDGDAVGTDENTPTAVPRFEMDIFYYGVPVRAYLFDPSQPGINFFVGISLGLLRGNVLVKSNDPNIADQAISISSSSVGATRLGIEIGGEKFGFRSELFLISAPEVEMSSNPFPGQSENTTLNFNGSLIRISLFWSFT